MTLVDLNAVLDPHGRFQTVVDGVVARWPDGIHITPAGGQWLQPRVLPTVAELGLGPVPAPVSGPESSGRRRPTPPARPYGPRPHLGHRPGAGGGPRRPAGLRPAHHHGLPLRGGALQGGFFSLDIFYVLSGYLITGLLLGEWARSARIRLGAFWLRRARRLLPGPVRGAGGGDPGGPLHLPGRPLPRPAHGRPVGAVLLLQLVADRRQRQLLRGHRGGVPPHPHLVAGRGGAVLPGVAPGGAGRAAPGPPARPPGTGRGRRVPRPPTARPPARPGGGAAPRVSVLGVVASAAEMARLYHPGVNITRLYFGTDTHAQSILVGAALACVLTLVQRHRGHAGHGPGGHHRPVAPGRSPWWAWPAWPAPWCSPPP